MRPLLLLLVVAACASPGKTNAPAARWEIDKEANLAIPVCPHCEAPVLRDETTCACGAMYRIEPKEIDCPECDASGHAHPNCEACEDTGECAICEGTGAFEGSPCPECEGEKACPDCAAAKRQPCPNCDGKGTIELR